MVQVRQYYNSAYQSLAAVSSLHLSTMASVGVAANEARENHLLHLIALKQQEIRHIREELKALAVEKAKTKKAEAKAKANMLAVSRKTAKTTTAATTAAAKSKGAVKKLQLKTCKRSCSVVTDGELKGLHKHPDHKYMVGVCKEGIRCGPGYECWQCMHRARGGKGGHVHSCKKVPYAR